MGAAKVTSVGESQHSVDGGNGRTTEIHEGHQTARPAISDGDKPTLQNDELSQPPTPSRRPRAWVLLSVFGLVAAAVGVAYYIYASGYESTDDAFIEGHVVPISSRVAGHVAKVYVDDNQEVKRGDLLIELDPRDFEAKLAEKEAGYQAARAGKNAKTIGTDVTEITSAAGLKGASASVAAASAEIDTARAAVATAKSQQAQAQAQLIAVEAGLAQAKADVQAAEARHKLSRSFLHRIADLVPQHAVSAETYDEAVAKDRVAEAEVAAVEQRVSAQEAAVKQALAAVVAADSGVHQAESAVAQRLAGLDRAQAAETSAKSGPQQVSESRSQTDVAQAEADRAKAEVEQAKLNLSYTKICAPVAGHVTRKSIEPGSYVQVGQALLALVEPNVWVVANFKETQLTNIRVGQPVSVVVDVYPGVKFAAHVESIQRGSGAHFSMLPPENATGNYVKVVQRVPVKIVFDDPKQVAEHLLGPGMSVVPTIDIRTPSKPGDSTRQE